MSKSNLSVTISTIVALAAIISPIFTTIINNLYLLKIKKLEMKQEEYKQTILHKRDILENYVRYLNEVYQNLNNSALSEYSHYYSLAYLYLPNEIQKKISRVNHLLGQSVLADIVDDIDEINSDICKELQKL